MTETPQTPEPAPAEAQAPAPAAGAPAGPGNGLGIASLIVGVVALITAFVPLCGMIAFVPAIVGLILGIINVMKRGKANLPKGVGIAGIILNIAAVAVIIIWVVFAVAAAPDANEVLESLKKLETQPAGV